MAAGVSPGARSGRLPSRQALSGRKLRSASRPSSAVVSRKAQRAARWHRSTAARPAPSSTSHAQRRPHAGDLVGRHGDTRACKTANDADVGVPLSDGLAHGTARFGPRSGSATTSTSWPRPTRSPLSSSVTGVRSSVPKATFIGPTLPQPWRAGPIRGLQARSVRGRDGPRGPGPTTATAAASTEGKLMMGAVSGTVPTPGPLEGPGASPGQGPKAQPRPQRARPGRRSSSR